MGGRRAAVLLGLALAGADAKHAGRVPVRRPAGGLGSIIVPGQATCANTMLASQYTLSSFYNQNCVVTAGGSVVCW